MNKTLGTILIVLAIVVLTGGIFFAGTMYARSNMMFGWNGNSGYGSGMMGQGGMTLAPGAHLPWRAVPGSAGVGGNGRIMSGMMNSQGGMMSGYGSSDTKLTPLTIDQAKAAAEKYLSNLNTSGLTIGEIMIFDNNAYVVVNEADTRLGAFELLVDPASQTAYPEHGPNMMWNLKYSGLNHQFMLENNGGMMGGTGMMSGNGWTNPSPADVSAEMTVTTEQAIEYAQKYLDENISDASASTHATQFYGYYTIDFEKDGKIIGMLSVNGFSGQVFVHIWHGTFVEEAE